MSQVQREFFENLKEENQEMTNKTPWKIFNRKFNYDLIVYLHYHESLEINFSRNVIGSIRVGNRELDLNEHPVIILSPGILHSYRFKKNSGEMLVVHISLKHLKYYLNLSNIFNELKVNPSLLPVSSAKYDLLRPHLERLASSESPIAKAAEILNLFGALEGLNTYSNFVHVQYNKLNRIVEYTENHYSNRDITLEEVSSFFNFSKSYFCRYFKKFSGLSYWKYLTYVRLDYAKRLLSNGTQVSESCYACGFDDISYFIRVFKKYNGVTPGQFLKRALQTSS